jgi:ectoine hydroxylase-related dioxygenase (phytanoyl-CoA dioxygenase family)
MLATQKSAYDRDGFLVVQSLFDDRELVETRTRVDALITDPNNPPPGITIGREGNTSADRDSTQAKDDSVRSAAFLVRSLPFFQDFARQPRLLDVDRGLLGPRVKVFRDQALFKPPGGQAKPPHQDQSYFQVEPQGDLVTAWIALDEATEANGCMCYIPGSHKHGIFPVDKDPDRPVHHVPDTGDLKLPPPVRCPVPAGSVIFHHGCTLHYSDENRTDTWRKAIIFHYATAQAHSANERLNEEISLEID